jgi:hypothetical protein
MARKIIIPGLRAIGSAVCLGLLSMTALLTEWFPTHAIAQTACRANASKVQYSIDKNNIKLLHVRFAVRANNQQSLRQIFFTLQGSYNGNVFGTVMQMIIYDMGSVFVQDGDTDAVVDTMIPMTEDIVEVNQIYATQLNCFIQQ